MDTNQEDELNPKWAKFIEAYLDSGNAYRSAIQAGFSEEYAKVITSRYPEKVRNSLKDALEHKGIDSAKIASKINELLEAKTVITKNNVTTGEVEIIREQPDYTAIDKGIRHAIQVRGDYAPEKHQNTNVNINGTLSDEAIRIAEEELKRRKLKHD